MRAEALDVAEHFVVGDGVAARPAVLPISHRHYQIEARREQQLVVRISRVRGALTIERLEGSSTP